LREHTLNASAGADVAEILADALTHSRGRIAGVALGRAALCDEAPQWRIVGLCSAKPVLTTVRLECGEFAVRQPATPGQVLNLDDMRGFQGDHGPFMPGIAPDRGACRLFRGY
jgi:hypothetical protein